VCVCGWQSVRVLAGLELIIVGVVVVLFLCRVDRVGFAGLSVRRSSVRELFCTDVVCGRDVLDIGFILLLVMQGVVDCLADGLSVGIGLGRLWLDYEKVLFQAVSVVGDRTSSFGLLAWPGWCVFIPVDCSVAADISGDLRFDGGAFELPPDRQRPSFREWR